MAKCKLCKKNIPDGTEYCRDCAEKKDLLKNESYLDGLLNSIQNNGTTASDIYKTRKKQDDAASVIGAQKEDIGRNSVDPQDLKDFDWFDMESDLNEPVEISTEDITSAVTDAEDISFAETDTGDINIPDLLMQGNMEDEMHGTEDSTGDDVDYIDDETINMDLDDLLKQLEMEAESGGGDGAGAVEDMANAADDEDMLHERDGKAAEYAPDSEDLAYASDNENAAYETEDESFVYAADDDLSDTAEDLIGTDDTDIGDIGGIIPGTDTSEDYKSEPAKTTEDELLRLLDGINPDDAVEDDIQAITDLLGIISSDEENKKEYPEDVGEVFSEALEAVTDLKDPDQGINYILQDEESETGKEKGRSKKKKDKVKEKEEKKSLFERLFANVEDEDEIPEIKRVKRETAAKAEKTKKKKAKGKKKGPEEEENPDELPVRRRQEEEPEEVKPAKKPKKEKKKKKKIEVIEEEEIDTGRINKAGASIVFVFFGIMTTAFLLLTNMFSYSMSIRNASDYFSSHRYTQAYNEVYGMELNDEDIELYDKIMTIMFVNKQLNSYNNYYHMKKYPEALDSLLKGLQRYEKYSELATLLGIKTDLDYVRDQILSELYNVFGLTEEQAVEIINSENRMQYSIAVYNVVLENMMVYDSQ